MREAKVRCSALCHHSGELSTPSGPTIGAIVGLRSEALGAWDRQAPTSARSHDANVGDVSPELAGMT